MKSKIIRKFSAGGVVLRKQNHQYEILLLEKQKDTNKEWLLPKGEIEEGEKSQDTVLREVTEETGLKDIEIISEIDKEEYFYRTSGEKDKLIFKNVRYFLIKSSDKNHPIPQKEEGFISAKWFSLDQALKVATYSKKIIKKAELLIKSH